MGGESSVASCRPRRSSRRARIDPTATNRGWRCPRRYQTICKSGNESVIETVSSSNQHSSDIGSFVFKISKNETPSDFVAQITAGYFIGNGIIPPLTNWQNVVNTHPSSKVHIENGVPTISTSEIIPFEDKLALNNSLLSNYSIISLLPIIKNLFGIELVSEQVD